jgi:hypothetical protein
MRVDDYEVVLKQVPYQAFGRVGWYKTGKPLERGLRNIIRTKKCFIEERITSTGTIILICQGLIGETCSPWLMLIFYEKAQKVN